MVNSFPLLIYFLCRKMDQGSDIPYTHMDPANLSLSSNSLIAEHVMITNVPCVTWDATIDKVIAEQANVWAASRTNFGRNCDQNMDPKKMRRYIIYFDVCVCNCDFKCC